MSSTHNHAWGPYNGLDPTFITKIMARIADRTAERFAESAQLTDRIAARNADQFAESTKVSDRNAKRFADRFTTVAR